MFNVDIWLRGKRKAPTSSQTLSPFPCTGPRPPEAPWARSAHVMGRTSRIHLALAAAVALLVVAPPGRARSAAASGDDAPHHGIAWAVQISDFHISKYAHPDIAPDLEVFGARCAHAGRWLAPRAAAAGVHRGGARCRGAGNRCSCHAAASGPWSRCRICSRVDQQGRRAPAAPRPPAARPTPHSRPPPHGPSVLAGVRPSALLLTGDLVDAKTANLEGSHQYAEEWEVRGRGPSPAQRSVGRRPRGPPSSLPLPGLRPPTHPPTPTPPAAPTGLQPRVAPHGGRRGAGGGQGA
jgi:hypothetical protein